MNVTIQSTDYTVFLHTPEKTISRIEVLAKQINSFANAILIDKETIEYALGALSAKNGDVKKRVLRNGFSWSDRYNEAKADEEFYISLRKLNKKVKWVASKKFYKSQRTSITIEGDNDFFIEKTKVEWRLYVKIGREWTGTVDLYYSKQAAWCLL